MVCKWQVEIDDYCNKVLEAHWPDVSKYREVRDVKGEDLESVDLICGGFPCTPISVAGERKAQEDKRWLWPEFARIIRDLRPRYVLVENVPGLRYKTKSGAAPMGDILGDLASLGYDAEWESIPAAAFGAPHLRYRVFIVAYANGERWSGESKIFSGVISQEVSEETQWKLSRTICSTNGKAALPESCGVYDGIPQGLHSNKRIAVLGNAVVPQVAEWIGKKIIEFDMRRV